MFRLSRRDQSQDRTLSWRLALLVLGMGVWIAGVVVERPVLTGAAIPILLVALILRLIDRKKE